MTFYVTQITSLNELIKLWPRLIKLAKLENCSVDSEFLLQLFLRCFNDGGVFVVRGDSGLAGSCLVEHSHNSTLVLHSIPNDKGTGIAKACLAAVKKWAREEDYGTLLATTSKLSGSSYRYFEKTLGFRRQTVTFKMEF
jgi:hypothetical protein